MSRPTIESRLLAMSIKDRREFLLKDWGGDVEDASDTWIWWGCHPIQEAGFPILCHNEGGTWEWKCRIPQTVDPLIALSKPQRRKPMW